MKFTCGFSTVNGKHLYINGHCVVCHVKQIRAKRAERAKPAPRKVIAIRYSTLGDANHYATRVPVRRVKVTKIDVKYVG
jgi:hypothetical protein